MRVNLVGGLFVVLGCYGCMGTATAEDDLPRGVTPVGAAGASGSAGSSGTGQELPIGNPNPDPVAELGAACDEARTVDATSETLLVRDPEVLKGFSLERVLTQIIESSKLPYTPLELLQRLFDTDNAKVDGAFADAVHCDDAQHPASTMPASGSCTRPEGRLARSTHLLEPGHPDSFVPVALVNRFDLTPSTAQTCGEYRIVFAKVSGRSDAKDRAFLIFEAAPNNLQGSLAGCRPVAELWASLPSLPTVADRAAQLEQFFFVGSASVAPVVRGEHYGLDGNCSYAGTCGQIRIGQGMQAPFEFRQFRLQVSFDPTERTTLAPVPNGGALRPSLFDGSEAESVNVGFVLGGELEGLARDPGHMMVGGFPNFEAGISALEGNAMPDYLARSQRSPGRAELEKQLTPYFDGLAPSACPPDDPLDVDAVLARASAVSCAGCHAPDRFLPEGRKLGCGQTWPQSHGETHIDEQGQLSEALTEVFLPRRAEVLATFLKACDLPAVKASLIPVRPLPLLK